MRVCEVGGSKCLSMHARIHLSFFEGWDARWQISTGWMGLDLTWCVVFEEEGEKRERFLRGLCSCWVFTDLTWFYFIEFWFVLFRFVFVDLTEPNINTH